MSPRTARRHLRAIAPTEPPQVLEPNVKWTDAKEPPSVVPLSPSSCSLAQRFLPYIRLLVALFRGNDSSMERLKICGWIPTRTTPRTRSPILTSVQQRVQRRPCHAHRPTFDPSLQRRVCSTGFGVRYGYLTIRFAPNAHRSIGRVASSCSTTSATRETGARPRSRRF